jgi:hypothetical protein
VSVPAVESRRISRQKHRLLEYFLRIFTYGPPSGEMKRADAYEEEGGLNDRFVSTLVIAASIIAAVRLARDDISQPPSRLNAVIENSIGVAKMILDKIMR